MIVPIFLGLVALGGGFVYLLPQSVARILHVPEEVEDIKCMGGVTLCVAVGVMVVVGITSLAG